jgi:two-component system OmpR family response regulator
VNADVLVVDDDPTVTDVVRRYLERAGYAVRTSADGRTGLAAALACPPSLLVLDLMLPELDGLELFRRLRAEQPVPVVMLTARGDEEDRVAGLELGADDYLPKPFGSRELVARIKAVLRRSRMPSASGKDLYKPKRYRFDRWTFDVESRELLRDDGVVVPLSTGEYDLLVALVERPKRTLNRDQLLDLARGRSAHALDRSIDTQVSRLRKKIERDPGDPKIIKTVWGGGYVFTPAVNRE